MFTGQTRQLEQQTRQLEQWSRMFDRWNQGVAHNVDALFADIAACVDEVRQMPPIDSEFVRSVVEALAQDS